MAKITKAEGMARLRLAKRPCANCDAKGEIVRKLRTQHVTLCHHCNRALVDAAQPREGHHGD